MESMKDTLYGYSFKGSNKALKLRLQPEGFELFKDKLPKVYHQQCTTYTTKDKMVLLMIEAKPVDSIWEQTNRILKTLKK